MMNYMDKWMCSREDCVKFSTCHRALTDEHRERADELGLRVQQVEGRPDCYEEESYEE